MLKNIEKQQVVIVLAAIAVVSIFGVLGYYPLLRRAVATTRDMRHHQQYGPKTQQIVQQVSALDRMLRETAYVESAFSTKIAADSQCIGELWGRIADAMKKHGLKDQIIQPGTETRGDRVGWATVKLQCSGGLSQIFAFLKSLNEFDKLIRVEQLRLSNSNNYSGQIKMNVEGKVFFHCSDGQDI